MNISKQMIYKYEKIKCEICGEECKDIIILGKAIYYKCKRCETTYFKY